MECVKAKAYDIDIIDQTRWATMEDHEEPCCTALPRWRAALDVYSARTQGAVQMAVVLWGWQSGVRSARLEATSAAAAERERLLQSHVLLSLSLERRQSLQRQAALRDRATLQRRARCGRLDRFVGSMDAEICIRDVAIFFLRWAREVKTVRSSISAPVTQKPSSQRCHLGRGSVAGCAVDMSLRGAESDLLKRAVLVWLLSALQSQALEVCAEVSELRSRQSVVVPHGALAMLQLRQSFVLYDIMGSWFAAMLRARMASRQPDGITNGKAHLNHDRILHELVRASAQFSSDRSVKRRVSAVDRAAVGVLRLRDGLILREVVRSWFDESLRGRSVIAESQLQRSFRRTSRLVAAVLLVWTAEHGDAFLRSVLHMWRECALSGTIDAFQVSLADAKRHHDDLIYKTLAAWRHNDNSVSVHVVLIAWCKLGSRNVCALVIDDRAQRQRESWHSALSHQADCKSLIASFACKSASRRLTVAALSAWHTQGLHSKAQVFLLGALMQLWNSMARQASLQQQNALLRQSFLKVSALAAPDPERLWLKSSARHKIDVVKAIVVPEIGKASSMEGAAAVAGLLSARPPMPPSPVQMHGPPGQCCVWPCR